MKHIQLTSRLNQDWAGKFVDEFSYDTLLSESAKVLKPDGSILCILLKNALDKKWIDSAWSVLKDYNQATSNRGVAGGGERKQRIRKDGVISKTNIADPVNSGIVGFFERNPRFPFCRACAWNMHNPEKWGKLLPMVQQVSSLFSEHGGERFLKQKEIVSKTNQDFVIPGTVFTTLTINKNFRTACHLDAGDLPQGLSCLSLIKEGRYTGANLVFPDFRVAAKIENGDLIIFDPHEFHGNTQLVPLSETHTRCTIVYYYREKMQHCLSMEQELERAKHRKQGEPMF